MVQEGQPLPEPARGRGPWQGGDPLASDSQEDRAPPGVRVGIVNGGLGEHQGAQSPQPPRHHDSRRRIPAQFLDLLRLPGAGLGHLLEGERGRELDPPLRSGVIERGHHQPILPLERLSRRQGGTAAVPEHEPARLPAAALRDAVRIGQGQQCPGAGGINGTGTGSESPGPFGGLHPDPPGSSRIEFDARNGRPPSRVSQRLDPEPQVGVGRAADTPGGIAVTEQGGELGGERALATLAGHQGHVGQPGMHAQPGHGPAVRGEASVPVEGAEPTQELPGLGEGRGGRRVEPAQGSGIAHPRHGEIERQGSQVRLEDFRRGVGDHADLVVRRPEPVAGSRAEAPRPPPSLVGRGAGDAHRLQPGHPGAGREAGHPGQSGVHDHPHALDGQAGLGDGGGQDHLAAAPVTGQDREVLGLDRHRTVQGMQRDCRIEAGLLQPLLDPADLSRPGQEDQDVSRPGGQGLPDHGRRGVLDPLPSPRRAVEGRHRKRLAFAPDDGGPAQQAGDPRSLQGGGHHQQPEVGAEHRLGFECQGETGVGGERAFVVLVEHQQAGSLQRRILLQHPGQHPLGDHLDPGPRRDLRFHPDPEANRLSHRLAQPGRHAPRGRPRGEPPRFEHHQLPAGEPRLPGQRQRHHGGLAGPRRRLEHRGVPGGQHLAEGREHGSDGQGGGHGGWRCGVRSLVGFWRVMARVSRLRGGPGGAR